MDYQELLLAIRLWLPHKHSVRVCLEAHRELLEAAFTEFQQAVPGCEIEELQNLLPEAIIAPSQGFLREALNGGMAKPWREFLGSLTLADVLFATACVKKSEAANQALIDLVNTEVRGRLAAKWPGGDADDVADELVQRLHLPDESGLNRGRPRLQSFYGRSRLLWWLRTVAANEIIDRRRRKHRSNCEWDALERPPTDPASVPANEVIARGQLEVVRGLIASAFSKLLADLRETAVTQYDFAYYRCVMGLPYAEIAERLAVTKSRVTELSAQVCGKLLSIFRCLDPEFAEARTEVTKEQRKLIEEAIHEWFSDVGKAGSDEFQLRIGGAQLASLPLPGDRLG